MKFIKSKLLIVIVLLTLIGSVVGIWFLAGKEGFTLIKDEVSVDTSASSSSSSTKSLKEEISSQISQIDQQLEKISPDDFNEEDLTEIESGL